MKKQTIFLTTLIIAAIFFTACEQIPDHCGKGVTYDPKFQFCFAGGAHNLCNGSEFNPLTQECMDEKTVGARCANGGPVTLGTPCNGYALSTASAPADGGEITRTPDNTNYPAGTDVVLFAYAATGYTFIGWAGASTSTSVSETVTMNSNKPLIALFQPNTPILVTTEYPPNGGNIKRVEDGDQVTVTAEANDNHTFDRWAGAVTSTQPTVTVTVDEGKTLVAIFTPARHMLTVNVNPVAGGTVFVDNTAMAGITYHDAGARVEVLAQAAAGYVFTGWSGASTSTNRHVSITMGSADQALLANFVYTGATTTDPCAADPGSAECCADNPGDWSCTVNYGSPVAQHGQLRVEGSQIVGSHGQPVQLRGMSLYWTMGPAGGRDYYNSSAIQFLASDWKASVVRATMGVEANWWIDQQGYIFRPEENRQRVITAVDAAIANNIYVIISWQSSEAESYQAEAIEFFRDMATRYGGGVNVIYEIYSGPTTRDGMSNEIYWSSVVKPYMQAVTDAIREIDPRNIILIGSPRWSQHPDVAAADPVIGDNLAYSMHIYAGNIAQRQAFRNRASQVMEMNKAVFASEFAATDAVTNSPLNLAETDIWIDFMDQHKIGWVNWSLNSMNETSAALTTGAPTTGNWNDYLSASGVYIRNKLTTAPKRYD